ncbi:hypothetical protein RJT34_01129 [Clitoria ternatea]|uniref:Wall-associated receptor kinase galacturonan-binding domain-containing protein n=1 Tax=Clitoria ternatea TaxID=43366 RepID=A0AAN9Q0E0_CLITE
MSPSGAERLSLWVVFLIILAFYGDATTDAELCAGRCGIHNISHPFRLQNSSDKCGDTRYNLSCENNQLMLYLGHGKYQVKSINYDNYTIRIVDDVNFEQHQHDYSYNFSNDAAPYQVYQEQDVHILVLRFRYRKRLAKQVLYLRCPNGNGVNSYAMSCMNKSNITSFYVIVNGGITSMSFRDAMVYNDGMSLWDLALGDSCRVEWTYLTSWPFNETSHHNNFSCRHIRDILLYGFELSWSKAICQDFGVAHVNNKSRCELPGLHMSITSASSCLLVYKSNNS